MGAQRPGKEESDKAPEYALRRMSAISPPSQSRDHRARSVQGLLPEPTLPLLNTNSSNVPAPAPQSTKTTYIWTDTRQHSPPILGPQGQKRLAAHHPHPMSPRGLSGLAISESREPVINANSQFPPSTADMVSFICQAGWLRESQMGKHHF